MLERLRPFGSCALGKEEGGRKQGGARVPLEPPAGGPDSDSARSCLLWKGRVTWVLTASPRRAKSAWTPSPRGPLPLGEEREPRETEEVAAAMNHQGPLQD